MILGILEPVCHLEEMLEIGATMEEGDERREIYEHHRETQTVLVSDNASASVSVSVSATAFAEPVADVVGVPSSWAAHDDTAASPAAGSGVLEDVP
jgi:hypothetical protein